MATTQRIEKTREMPSCTRARGHLSLVEWNAEAEAPRAATPKRSDPVRRTGVDRLYEGGALLLMASATLAVIASFAHL